MAVIKADGLSMLHLCHPDLQSSVHAAVVLWLAYHNTKAVHGGHVAPSQTHFQLHQPQEPIARYKKHNLTRDVMVILHGVPLYGSLCLQSPMLYKSALQWEPRLASAGLCLLFISSGRVQRK